MIAVRHWVGVEVGLGCAWGALNGGLSGRGARITGGKAGFVRKIGQFVYLIWSIENYLSSLHSEK